MNFCNSVNKAKFLTKLCEESKRQSESDELRYKREWLQINLSSLRHMRNENRTNDTDLHILQWRHGCAAECHSNGLVTFLQGTDEYAYNGETLTFNLSKHWKPLVHEHGIIWNRESVSRLERKCVETLTSLSELQREGKFIKKALPDIYFFVKASGSSEQQVLVCLATGFYPKHVQMEIRRDQTLLPDEQLNSSGIRPNADGSFQLKKSLKILPSERSRYQCVVTEWILPITSMAYRDGVLLYIVILVRLIVVPIVLTIYLLIKYIKHPKKQKTPKTPSQVKLLKTPAGLAAALNASSDEENAADDSMEEVQTEELHETQSLCEAKETPAAAPTAARGAMGSKYSSLPNFAMKREDTDQNTVTQNTLLLPLQRHCRSKTISMPALGNICSRKKGQQ
uniref:Ig-like domain-containing protein n=1 Tax=Cyprinus carpio carpio TaxID=630221 RepID=A0A9J7ZPJ2_CYPCA